MKLLRRQFGELINGSALTIGNFDGVHRGHKALLCSLRQRATLMHLPVVVLLFEPQPGEYFLGQDAPVRLSSLREKIDAFSGCGVDYVYCLPFDARVASMEAHDFAKRIIFSLLQAKLVLIGEDFRFGQGRQGDFFLLQKVGSQHAAQVVSFHDFFMGQERVSSTKVRQALQHDLTKAEMLLGRAYSLCGRVVHGDGRGRQWGVPTANISLGRKNLPLSGVFCVRVTWKGLSLDGVANLGCRPTVDGHRVVLEVHLFGWDKPLYGERLQVSFLHKLRQEVKFSSLDELITQIHVDLNNAKQWFHQREMSYD